MRFEELIERDAPLEHVLPSIHSAHRERYAGLHDPPARAGDARLLQGSATSSSCRRSCSARSTSRAVACAPNLANDEFTRGNVELVAIREIDGRVAAEGALPYPPGILCVVPGEVWGVEQRDYFLALEEGINLLPVSRQSCRAFICWKSTTGRSAPTATSCPSDRAKLMPESLTSANRRARTTRAHLASRIRKEATHGKAHEENGRQTSDDHHRDQHDGVGNHPAAGEPRPGRHDLGAVMGGDDRWRDVPRLRLRASRHLQQPRCGDGRLCGVRAQEVRQLHDELHLFHLAGDRQRRDRGRGRRLRQQLPRHHPGAVADGDRDRRACCGWRRC